MTTRSRMQKRNILLIIFALATVLTADYLFLSLSNCFNSVSALLMMVNE